MKTTFLKTMILPVAAFILASAGAVSSHETKLETAKKPPLTAFAHTAIPGQCLDKQVNCSTTVSPNFCMSSDATPQQVWLKNGTGECIVNLYRP